MRNILYKVALIKEEDNSFSVRSKEIFEHPEQERKKYETDKMFQGYERTSEGFREPRRIYKAHLGKVGMNTDLKDIIDGTDVELAYTYCTNKNLKTTRAKVLKEFTEHYQNLIESAKRYIKEDESITEQLSQLSGA